MTEGEPKPQKTIINFKQFLNRLLEIHKEFDREVIIKFEDHTGKEYTSYHLKFDFGVDTFESFVIVNWENDLFDEVQLINELDEIELKAKRLQES